VGICPISAEDSGFMMDSQLVGQGLRRLLFRQRRLKGAKISEVVTERNPTQGGQREN
jgi:hypothetical protein